MPYSANVIGALVLVFQQSFEYRSMRSGESTYHLHMTFADPQKWTNNFATKLKIDQLETTLRIHMQSG